MAAAPITGDAPVLFLSNNFPPEVNALANRTWEHARQWSSAGGQVAVIAGPPHFPEGRVYDGYRNALTRETFEGVEVLRVPMYVHPNEGFLRRTLSYVSYMVSAALFSGRTKFEPGVVAASSPQFFAGLAGNLVSRWMGLPFVLEIRDLWPESIVDVGAMKRGVLVSALERIESFLYRSADQIVVVSPAFRDHIEARGVPADRITVLPNGIDVDWFAESIPAAEVMELKKELEVEGRFIASYIGTVGMAHGVGVMLEAARACPDPDVVFVVVGPGAGSRALRDEADALGLTNVRIIEKQPRERIRSYYAMSDVSVVHLRDLPAFRKVIPSKMFESMAMRRPLILGVAGQAADILEAAGAGVSMRPEDAGSLIEAVLRLKEDPILRERFASNGETYVRANFDRREIARRYWQLLQEVAARA